MPRSRVRTLMPCETSAPQRTAALALALWMPLAISAAASGAEDPAKTSGASTSGPQRFRVSPEESDVYVQLRPAEGTLLSGLSHEHVIVARNFSGEVEWNPERPDQCWIEVTVPVADLDVDPPQKREALGFDKGLSDGDRKTVAKHMRAKGQLWADRHSTIHFRATQCDAGPDDEIRVTGALAIRGVSKRVSLLVDVDFEPEGLRARVDFRQVHADFGFEPYSKLLGALKNDETLSFHVDVWAQRVPEASGATTGADETRER